MPDETTYTIDEFCAAEKMSRGMIYLLWKTGKGPRFFFIGNRRRISGEARTEWQLEAEAAASSKTVVEADHVPSAA